MKVELWLKEAAENLEQAGIGTARLDCLVLLEDVSSKHRGWLLAHPEFELTSAQLNRLSEHIERRTKHEPLAYIRNKTEFYGREFYIDHHVLEPRPESETMIELLKGLTLPKTSTIIDVGTGSGALAITAKLELPTAEVIAIDIDPNCLKVATKNAQKLQADIKFLKGDLLAPISKLIPKNCVLLCNLPYIPDTFHINQAAMTEPKIAIFGGADGLDLYRHLFKQLKNIKYQPKYILTESLPPQHEKLAEIAKASGYRLAKTDDFIQCFKSL